MPTPRIIHGDCITEMRRMGEASIDAIVTDPPYGLGFMGKKWDALPPGEEWARECLRVLKPGGHLLAFGGTRTWHRLAVAVEDAGFEIRDSIAWLYGSGFPKSTNVSKAIDRAAGKLGAESKRFTVAGVLEGRDMLTTAPSRGYMPPAPATPDAERWQGWGTALKPAFEPVVVARKPLEGTVAANVLAHGTGALNIDATRIGTDDALVRPAVARTDNEVYGTGLGAGIQSEPAGRWSANVVLDDTTAAILDGQSGVTASRVGKPRTGKSGDGWGMTATGAEYDDAGGASRFFYVAKAPKRERPNVDGVQHPTVKPLTLMRWLVRLVTPPGGTVLDPFAGSGTTIEAALLEGFDVIGIERETEYLPLIQQRIDRVGNTLI